MRMPDDRARLAVALSANGTEARAGGEEMGERMSRAAAHLRAAELYWVSRDMTSVALDASADLPDWTPAGALPAPLGVVVWEQGLPAMPAAGVPRVVWPMGALGAAVPPRVEVDAVLWAQYGGAVHVTVLTRTHRLRSLVDAGARAGVDLVIPADVALWPMSSMRVPATEPITGEDMHGDGAGLVAALGATWLLMQQPTVATGRRVTPTGRAQRLASREGRPPEQVSIIDLRRMDYYREDPGAGGTGREYHHRWIVRGHWRQQAHGPGRSQRRPTWVPSYVKGPADAPLLTTEHVHVWRR